MTQLLESQNDISKRLKRLEVVPVESLLAKDSDIQSLRSFRPGSSSRASIRSTSGTFAFDNILHVTRVYKRALSNRPTSAVPLSGASQYTGCSYFSGISLAEISHISVLSLPIYSFEISNSQNYSFGAIPEEDVMPDGRESDSDTTRQDQLVLTTAVKQVPPPRPFLKIKSSWQDFRPKSRLRLWRRGSFTQPSYIKPSPALDDSSKQPSYIQPPPTLDNSSKTDASIYSCTYTVPNEVLAEILMQVSHTPLLT